MPNRRRMAQLITKSMTGEPLNWRDSLRLLWATTDPKRRKVSGLAALIVQIVITSIINIVVVCIAKPTIGGWALLLGAMVWLALAAHWCRRG